MGEGSSGDWTEMALGIDNRLCLRLVEVEAYWFRISVRGIREADCSCRIGKVSAEADPFEQDENGALRLY